MNGPAAEMWDRRTGTIGDVTAFDWPNGPKGGPHFVFNFTATTREYGVFYVNLNEPDGMLMSGIALSAFANKSSIEMVYSFPPTDPPTNAIGGFVRGLRIL
jgi:hypothetical protein